MNAQTRLLSEKQQAGADILDLSGSNPTISETYPHDRIQAAFAEVTNFVYHPDPRGSIYAREAISNFYRGEGCDVPASQILLTASTSEAYGLLFKLLCEPGDEILVPVPSYPLFEYLAAAESVRIVPYRLQYDGSWSIDFTDLKAQISTRSRAMIVVNPNNPTGSFLKLYEYAQLAALAQAHDLPIISDEVFMSYSFTADLSQMKTLTAQDEVLSFSLNGLSKAAGMPQMKLAWIAVNGPAVKRESAEERLELLLDTYLSVNTPVQLATPSLLEIGRAVRSEIRGISFQNFLQAQEICARTPLTVLHTEGGWSVILRLPATQSEEQWTIGLLEKENVLVQPGFFFDMPRGSYAVASLLTPPHQFAEGLQRLREYVLRNCEITRC